MAAGIAARAALMKKEHQPEERDAHIHDDEAFAGFIHDPVSSCTAAHGSPEWSGLQVQNRS